LLAAQHVLAGATNAPLAEALSLPQAYERMLGTDQGIGIALAEIQRARLLPLSALTRQIPRLTANANWTKPQENIAETSRVETKRADLTVELPLIDLSVFPAYREGKLADQAARVAFRQTVRGALFGVTAAYYDVLKRQQVLEVNRQTRELAQRQFDLAEKRFKVGDVIKTDVLRARVTLERAQRTVTESENAARLAQSVLASVLNAGTERSFVLQEPPAYPDSTVSLEQLQQQATANREELQVADLLVEQTKARRAAVRSQYGPRVVALWSHGWIDPETASNPNNFWQATVGVQWPLFEGGQREIELRRVGQELVQVQLRREELAKSVAIEVKQAWLRVHSLEQTLQALRAEVQAADENYRSLENQYRAGTATSLDVLDGLRELNRARTELAVESYDYQLALREIEQVTGLFEQARVQKVNQP
jgi:outer membrane protein TolC